MNAKEHFDEDYQYVRKMLMSGKLKLEDAKNWIRQIGWRTETRTLREMEEQMGKVWGSNVARETERERLLFGKPGEDDE